MNACIRQLPTIDGQAVFTVEGLKRGDEGERGTTGDNLHPVQQAMVDHHASQCGFCTPGFVMSLFALYKTTPQPSRAQVMDALSGNLCRCTGYRPILDAAAAMHGCGRHCAADASPVEAWLNQPAQTSPTPHPGEAALATALLAIRRDTDFVYEAGGVTFHAPRSVDAFSRLAAAHPDAWILAGGTDVGLWINKGLQTTRTILYTGAVQGLDDIQELAAQPGGQAPGWLDIGAAVTLQPAFDALNRHYPELAHVWQRFASVPIRSSGTLGGNIANGSPIGDSMPLLIALDCEVVLRLGSATRTLPLEHLYLDYKKQARAPGEWVERVRVPLRRNGLELAAYKNAKRNEQDISAVCFAIALQREAGVVRSVRIALGGMAGIPKRAAHVEVALIGKVWNEDTVRAGMAQMAQDFTPLGDMRATAAYRLRVAQNLLLRFFFESTAGATLETRVI